jgi:hypothetical protein
LKKNKSKAKRMENMKDVEFNLGKKIDEGERMKEKLRNKERYEDEIKRI